LDGPPASNFKIVFERFLFNEERHRSASASGHWKTFCLIHEQAQQVVAQIHFQVADSIAFSPARAPFGSIEFSDSLLPETLLSFWTATEQNLKSAGVKKIVIKDTAHQYRPGPAALLTVLFLSTGFSLSNTEINSAINVDAENFESKISYAEVKRMRRCQQEKMEFQILSLGMLEEVYAFIQSCRHQRGMSLSMTFPQLRDTIKNCHDDFFLFGIFQNAKLMAASVSVRVSNRILYDFYHAHAKSVDQLSPVVLLLKGMYEFCQKNKFELLDLGTSAVDQQINFGLLNFKTQIGGQLSVKLTFEKDLN